jgi:hypothetical protein
MFYIKKHLVSDLEGRVGEKRKGRGEKEVSKIKEKNVAGLLKNLCVSSHFWTGLHSCKACNKES